MKDQSNFFKLGYLGIILATILVLSDAQAEKGRSYSSEYRTTRSNYGGSSGRHAVSAALGIYNAGATTLSAKVNSVDSNVSPVASGLFGIGGDYEFLVTDDFGVGAVFRYYSSSETLRQNLEQKVSVWNLAAIARAYLSHETFLPYLGAGLGIVSASVKQSGGGSDGEWDPSATIGLNFVMGLLYKVDSRMSFGVENMRVFALGEKLNGQPVNDFMFKGRFVF